MKEKVNVTSKDGRTGVITIYKTVQIYCCFVAVRACVRACVCVCQDYCFRNNQGRILKFWIRGITYAHAERANINQCKKEKYSPLNFVRHISDMLVSVLIFEEMGLMGLSETHYEKRDYP